MELTKQQAIDKILSFNYTELAGWIGSRLRGDDKYFPVYSGHEPNLSEFLLDSFHHIKNEKYRGNFIEILGDLTRELRGFDKRQIEESREYISELLFLCGNIKQFENKDTLLAIAVSGKLKGTEIDEETDLHAELLTTLASFRIAGICEFWIEQLLDDSNRYYAGPAFYGLMDYPDRLFNHMATFIDKFKGKAQLVLGIISLLNEYGKKNVVKQFKSIEANLSPEQKEAVNAAFIKADCTVVYRPDAPVEERLHYKLAPPRLQYVSHPTPVYGAGTALKDKVGEIFTRMGFQVEVNREIAGRLIDFFIKKKKTFIDQYECWICICHEGTRKVNKDAVINLHSILRQPDCIECGAMIISEKDFTREAIKAGKVYGIELKTLEQLYSYLDHFYSQYFPASAPAPAT